MPDSWALPDMWDTYGAVVVSVLAVTAGWMAAEVSHRVLRRIGRRVPLVAGIRQRIYRPAQMLAITLGARVAISMMFEGQWREPALHGLLLASIAAAVWLITRVLYVLEEAALPRIDRYHAGSPEARRLHTRVVIIRRLIAAAATVIGVGVALTTFDAVRGIGTSLLASAGLLGVVAGLAAQSTLGNMFAGLQLAFGNRLRLGDVVVVEGEWGTIEEMTLGYVVVHIWDQRRLILPSSYFTTNPFVNWTRRDAAILGTVEMDVDWLVPVPEMRAELEEFVRKHPAWDGRAVSLLVTGTTGSLVRVRPLVSAGDGLKVWELQCAVREHLVGWVRTHYPQALPRMRTEWAGAPSLAPPGPGPGPGLGPGPGGPDGHPPAVSMQPGVR